MLFGLFWFGSKGFTYYNGFRLVESLGMIVAKCFFVLERFCKKRRKSKLAFELAIIFL